MARERKLIFEGVVLHLLPQSNHDNYTESAPEDIHKSALKKTHDRPDRNGERDREVHTCREKMKGAEKRERSGRSISEQRNVISMNLNNHPSNYRVLVQGRF